MKGSLCKRGLITLRSALLVGLLQTLGPLVVPAAAQSGANLPLPVKLDLLVADIKAAEQAGSLQLALAKLDDYQAISPLPSPLLYVDATIALRAGNPVRAGASFEVFFRKADSTSPLYAPALAAYRRATAAIPAYQAKEAEQRDAKAAMDTSRPGAINWAAAKYVNAYPTGTSRAAVIGFTHARLAKDGGWFAYGNNLKPGPEQDFAFTRHVATQNASEDLMFVWRAAKDRPPGIAAKAKARAIALADPAPTNAFGYLRGTHVKDASFGDQGVYQHLRETIAALTASGGRPDYSLGDALTEAIWLDDPALVETIVRQGKLDLRNVKCIKFCDGDKPGVSRPPIQIALASNSDSVVAKLMDLGVRIDSEFLIDLTISGGHWPIVTRLISEKAITAASTTNALYLEKGPLIVYAVLKGAPADVVKAMRSIGQTLPASVFVHRPGEESTIDTMATSNYVCSFALPPGVVAYAREQDPTMAFLTAPGRVPIQPWQIKRFFNRNDTGLTSDCLMAKSVSSSYDTLIEELIELAREAAPGVKFSQNALPAINSVTVLHTEAVKGHNRNVAALLKLGWDPNVRMADGRAPLDLTTDKATADALKAAGGQCATVNNCKGAGL